MIFLKSLPDINKYIDSINQEVIKLNKKPLSKAQKSWLSFTLTAIIITSKLCWKSFERSSLGNFKSSRLSWMFIFSPIPWEYLYLASIRYILRIFCIKEATLVIDDVDRERSKRTKNLYGVFKTRSKKGGYTNAQNIVFLILVTKKITLPVGFYFYRPDPDIRDWKKKDKKLIKKKIPKCWRPPRPPYGEKYPPKKKIAFKLLCKFKYRFKNIKVNAIMADSAYYSKYLRDSISRLYPKSPFISQLRKTSLVFTRKYNIKYTLEEYFSNAHLRKKEIYLRGTLAKTYYYSSARLFVKSLGRVIHVVAIKEEGEKRLRYLCSSDLTWRAEDILKKYSYRWLIEVFFQDWKQYDGWGKLAYQYNVEGAYRGVILSLLLDHFLIQHPTQLHLARSGRPLSTTGSLQRKLQFESFIETIDSILNESDPREKVMQLKESMDNILIFKRSDKHMSGRKMFEATVSPSLKAKFKNTA